MNPLHKKGAKNNPSNYRPISLTSIPCKLLEHIIKSSMYNHLEKYRLITNKQHGFRKHFSCTTQLLSIVHDLCQAINAKGQTNIIYLDFSKAFDKVSHRKILQKLNSYGFRGLSYSWIRSLLSSRTQAVVMDGDRSFPCEVLSGVSQRTVLGPILFLIYINEIVDGLQSNIYLFSDDCVLYRKIESEEDNRILLLLLLDPNTQRRKEEEEMRRVRVTCRLRSLLHNVINESRLHVSKCSFRFHGKQRLINVCQHGLLLRS